MPSRAERRIRRASICGGLEPTKDGDADSHEGELDSIERLRTARGVLGYLGDTSNASPAVLDEIVVGDAGLDFGRDGEIKGDRIPTPASARRSGTHSDANERPGART